MAINKPEITAVEHSSLTDTAIEITTTQPTDTILSTAVNPGKLLGYYSAALDTVQLYVSDRNGLRWLPVTFNG